MANTTIKQAIVLAAGEGRKAWPYGVTQNKAAFPVAGQPLIRWTVAMLREAGIGAITVVCGYRQEQLRYALRDLPPVQWIEQTNPIGTAHALLTALQAQNWQPGDDILVLYGDVVLTPEHLEPLIGAEESPAALMYPVAAGESRHWLCARVDGGRIVQVLGHPREDVTHRFAGGFRFRPAELLPFLEANPGRMQSIEVGQMPPDEWHFEESIQMSIEAGMEWQAVEIGAPFVDIDKPWHLMRANYELAHYRTERLTRDEIAPTARVHDSALIEGHIRLGEHSEIGPRCIIKGNLIVGDNTIITDGAIVEANCVIGNHTRIQRYCQVEKGSVVGDHCIIGHAAEFGGLMMDRTYFYHYGEYWGVLGTACDLGAATVCGNLRFDDDQTEHRIRGHKEKPDWGANAAYLGDYVRTGVNCIIMPGVKVGPWSVLGAGTIISEDVPERMRVWVEQQIQRKSWGPERYGW